MSKYLIHIFILVALAFVTMRVASNQKELILPAFAQKDEVVLKHNTQIKLKVASIVRPGETTLEQLKTDYAAIWAHLNHLYNTNDTEKGKEYYTEDFFKALHHGESIISPAIQRTDLEHNLNITQWSRDGLVCVAIDSNVVLQYQENNKKYQTKTTIAIALLYQGEHWRLDAIQFIK